MVIYLLPYARCYPTLLFHSLYTTLPRPPKFIHMLIGFVCLSVRLAMCLSGNRSVRPSVCLSSDCLSVCLSVCLPIYTPTRLSVCRQASCFSVLPKYLHVCLSVYVSVYPTHIHVCLFGSLSVCSSCTSIGMSACLDTRQPSIYPIIQPIVLFCPSVYVSNFSHCCWSSNFSHCCWTAPFCTNRPIKLGSILPHTTWVLDTPGVLWGGGRGTGKKGPSSHKPYSVTCKVFTGLRFGPRENRPFGLKRNHQFRELINLKKYMLFNSVLWKNTLYQEWQLRTHYLFDMAQNIHNT